jgi:hypothetical protein
MSRIVVFGTSGPARSADISLKRISAFLSVSGSAQIRSSRAGTEIGGEIIGARRIAVNIAKLPELLPKP